MKIKLEKLYRKLTLKPPPAKKPRLNKWMTRRFQMQDLCAVPADWNVSPPAFIGLGCPKAGTTWWYRLILEHPAVKPNRLKTKELSYFFHFGYEGPDSQAIETYRQAFAAPIDSISGEWSAGYLNYPLAIYHLVKTVPEARLLVLVRNPIDRTVSHWNHLMTNRFAIMNLDGDKGYFLKNYSLFPDAIIRSLLYASFQRLFEIVDRSKVLVLQYEKCRSNPTVEIRKTYQFLGIDDSFVPSDFSTRVNVHPYIVPKPATEQRALLAKYFRDDVHSLARLVPEIDLSLWPDFH